MLWVLLRRTVSHVCPLQPENSGIEVIFGSVWLPAPGARRSEPVIWLKQWNMVSRTFMPFRGSLCLQPCTLLPNLTCMNTSGIQGSRRVRNASFCLVFAMDAISTVSCEGFSRLRCHTNFLPTFGIAWTLKVLPPYVVNQEYY